MKKCSSNPRRWSDPTSLFFLEKETDPEGKVICPSLQDSGNVLLLCRGVLKSSFYFFLPQTICSLGAVHTQPERNTLNIWGHLETSQEILGSGTIIWLVILGSPHFILLVPDGSMISHAQCLALWFCPNSISRR